jgi:hypothetical protein
MMTMMLGFLLFSLAAGILCGTALVWRGGRENSLIGLSVATICSVTALVLMDKYWGIAFSKDIGFYLVFPGVFGVIYFAMVMRGVAD